MRWSGYVNDVHIGIMHEISPIRVGLMFRAELLHTLLKGVVKVVPVHITDRDQPAALVTYEVKATHSDSAHSDYSARELIARSDVLLVAAHGAEHITWQDREQRQSRRRFLQKASSGFTHSAIVINEYPYVLSNLQKNNLHHLLNLRQLIFSCY